MPKIWKPKPKADWMPKWLNQTSISLLTLFFLLMQAVLLFIFVQNRTLENEREKATQDAAKTDIGKFRELTLLRPSLTTTWHVEQRHEEYVVFVKVTNNGQYNVVMREIEMRETLIVGKHEGKDLFVVMPKNMGFGREDNDWKTDGISPNGHIQFYITKRKGAYTRDETYCLTLNFLAVTDPKLLDSIRSRFAGDSILQQVDQFASRSIRMTLPPTDVAACK